MYLQVHMLMKQEPESSRESADIADSGPAAQTATMGTTGDDFPIIGLGASAGGLEAFQQFLDAMPPNSGMAFVLIQHLDPEHESHLPRLLSSHTQMRVLTAETDQFVAPNHVYIIPPKSKLQIASRILTVSEPDEPRATRKPIDTFFLSLAKDQRNKAIGIVLSGTGSDGTHGLIAIKEAGGLAIVQSPDKAAYDGMPRSAISAGAADHVVSIDDMVGTLINYLDHIRKDSQTQDALPGERARSILTAVVELLKLRTLIDFASYKQGTLLRRIERRMDINHLGNGASYLTLLKTDSGELDKLCKDLLINVTCFFRDSSTIDCLSTTVLPELIKAHPKDHPFRVWVAGCSTGEEAYSVAILLIEEAESQGLRLQLQIFATDLDGDALAVARAGIYPDTIETDVSEDRLNRFFTREDHHYRVATELRESIVFAEHNLLSDAPFSRLDLVSCRNVLIYLDAPTQGRLLEIFHFGLRKGGVLMLGTAEMVPDEVGLFEPVSREYRLYRRNGVRARAPRRSALTLETAAPRGSGIVSSSTTAPPAAATASRLAQRLLLERYSPAAILINRKYEGLYYSGPVDRFMKVPDGEPGQDVLSMAREGLRGKLRAIVNAVIASGNRMQSAATMVDRSGARSRVIIHAEPVRNGDETLLLITFREDVERQSDVPALVDTEDSSMVQRLERELQTSQKELAVTIHNLESANEDLTAANEEAMSMNEEFQSTNEELETSREELQSFNEELTTLNSQLQQQIDEHRKLSTDLDNLLNSVKIATIFLDENLCINRFTPSIRELFNLLVSDVGRPIADITPKFNDVDLLRDANQVFKSHEPIEAEVASHAGRWYLRRILPYKTLSNKVHGVVITFNDVTDLKQSQQAAVSAQDYAEAIIDTVREPLVVLDASASVISASHSFYEMFDRSKSDTVGRCLYDFAGGPWNLPSLRLQLERTRAGESTEATTDLQQNENDSEQRIYRISTRRVKDDDSQASLILLSIDDITERRHVERKIEEQNAKLNSILESAQVAIVTIDERGIVSTFSAAAERMFGYTAEEVIGNNVKMLMSEEDSRQHHGYITAYLETGEKKIIGKGREVLGQRKDGTLIPLDLSIGEVWVQNERLFTGVMRDLTLDNKRQEDLWQAQKMDAMGQLTGGVAHDFNNLLTVILGNLEMLGSEGAVDNRDELVAEAKKAVNMGSNLIAELMAFGRKIPMRSESLDLNDVVVDFSGMLRRTLPESVQMQNKLDDELWTVFSDAVQLQNALLNLVLNASSAMPGGGTLTIETSNTHLDSTSTGSEGAMLPGDYVVLAVSDTGVGMPLDVQKRAFEPFYTTKEIGQGSGMGLSMIYGFAKQSNGYTSIYSEPGNGTTVKLYLPRHSDQPAQLPIVKTTDKQWPGSGETILVVEDDPMVCRLTVKRLRFLGYKVLQADCASSALALLEEHGGVDLLFSDIIMPGAMTGVDLAEQARKVYPALKVLLASGYSAETLDIAHTENFVNKPYSIEALSGKLREALDS